MTVKEAILTLNANAVIACERAGFSSATVKMIEDALDTIEDALHAQEPRVMTATEAYTADCVYIEFGGVITPAIRTSNERNGHRESYFAIQQLGGDWMRWDDYGKTWRCWTSRPTDAQREAVKWDG